jgi:hypothetical protein
MANGGDSQSVDLSRWTNGGPFKRGYFYGGLFTAIITEYCCLPHGPENSVYYIFIFLLCSDRLLGTLLVLLSTYTPTRLKIPRAVVPSQYQGSKPHDAHHHHRPRELITPPSYLTSSRRCMLRVDASAHLHRLSRLLPRFPCATLSFYPCLHEIPMHTNASRAMHPGRTLRPVDKPRM